MCHYLPNTIDHSTMYTQNNPSGYIFKSAYDGPWNFNKLQYCGVFGKFGQFVVEFVIEFVIEFVTKEELSINHPLQLYLAQYDSNDSTENKFCRMIIALDNIICKDKYHFNSI